MKQATCILIQKIINNVPHVLAVARRHTTDCFGLPGGKVDATDKNKLAAAVREFYEEVVTSGKLKNAHPVFVAQEGDYMVTTYAVDFTGDTSFATGDAGTVAWVTWDALTSDKAPFQSYNRALKNIAMI